MASPPPTRPSFPSRTHSLPSSRPSSSTSHYASFSSRSKKRPQARPILERATSLRASSSLLESDGSDDEEGGGKEDFCRRYLSRRGGFESEEEDEAAGKAESSFARWGRGYFPFSSRPSSRSSSASSSSRPIRPIHTSRPRGLRTRSRSNSTSSLSSHHRRHSLLLSSTSPWSNHPGKASATLGLITPSFDVLSWSLSLPHPHPSSYPRFKNSHRILLRSHRMHQISLSLQNRNRSTASNLAAPSSTLPDYPSPAGSETTIRPSRPSSAHRHQSHPQSNFYSCSPPPFRSTIIPTFLSSRSSSRSYSSEADDDLAAFSHHTTIPTSYSSYLRAGGSSPSSSTGERTPRASRAPSRQGSTGGGASWESSPTATRRRGGVAPSLSFTASTRASSVASMGSASSPKDFFSGGGGGRLQSRSTRVGREEVADDEEALSPSPSYLTFGSFKREAGSSLGGSRAIASPGVKRRDGSLSRAGGAATRGGKAVRAVQQRPVWR